jgi:hypothetical protein
MVGKLLLSHVCICAVIKILFDADFGVIDKLNPVIATYEPGDAVKVVDNTVCTTCIGT